MPSSTHSSPNPSPRPEAAARPRRRWLLVLLLPGLAIAAALGLRALLHPERISDFLLQQGQQATGLELSLDRPADVGLWPDLHVQLTGLGARAPGAAQPLLRAERIEAALPWSMLRNQDITLLGLRLISPQLDLVALQDFLDRDDDIGPPAPMRIPTLDAPLEVRDGRIAGDGWALEQLDLTLPALHEGARTSLGASALWVSGTDSAPAAGQRFALQLAAVPHSDGSTLRLDQIALDLVLDAVPQWRPRIEGIVSWNPSGTLALALTSQIAAWPADWPALPLPPGDADATVLALAYSGDAALTGLATFSLWRDDDGLRGALTLHDTLAWLGGKERGLVPPAEGEIRIPRLEYEGIQAEGIRIRLTPPGAEDAEKDAAH